MRIPAPLSRTLAASLLVFAFSACSGNESPDVLVARAHEAIRNSDPKAAEIHLKNLLQQDDRNSEARFLLGELYRQANDLRSARKEYERAHELGWDADQVLPPLLDTMLRLGDAEAVVAAGSTVVLDDPAAKARSLTAVAQAQLRLGRRVQARESFSAALAAKDDYVPAQVGVAALQAGEDMAGARAAVAAILQRAPESVDALTLSADLDLLEGKLQPARNTYRRVIELKPDEVGTRAKLVSLSMDLNDVDTARSDWADLHKIAPTAPFTHFLLAQIEARDNHPDKAREAVQEALQLAPDYLPAIGLAARLSLAANSFEQSERHARTLIERLPQSPIGYRVLGATHLRRNHPDKALEAAQSGIARNANDAMLLAIAGEAALKMNDPENASDYFRRATTVAPENARLRTGLALSHLASGDKARGIDELEQAIELDSNDLQADVALVMTHLRDQRYDEALDAVQRMASKAPKSPVPDNLRGGVLAAKGDAKAARAAFVKALEVDPAFYPAAANLAALDLREQRPGDARSRYESVLAKDPKNAQAAVALAALTQRTGGTHEQVLEQLRKAREASPDSVLPILATARYMIETNAPKDAIPMLQEASNRNPEDLRVLDTLAIAFSRSEQRTQAIATWEKMLRVNSKAASAHVRIGDLQFAEGNYDAALQSFRKAAEIAPEAVEPQTGMARTLYRQGRKDEAIRVAKRMAQNDKTKAAGLMLEGDLLAAGRNWNDAGDRYRDAFSAQRTLTAGAKAHRAMRAANDETGADAFLREWVRSDPQNLQLRMYAGESETQLRRWKASFDHYAVVVEKEPMNPIALNNAAWALHELKDARAVEYGRRAWEAAPKSASIIDTYGTILAELGDRKSIGLLRQAVELAPGNPALRLHLAQALAKFDDTAGAQSQLEILLKATPEGAVADQARALQAKLR